MFRDDLQRIKIGLVGCGVISYAHMNAYAQIPQAEVVAVCDIFEPLASSLAKRYGIKEFYTDYEKMLKREDIDVIDVCTPTSLHKDFTIKALEAGKHVFCEKPIASNLMEADEIIDSQKKFKKYVLIGHSNRYLPITINSKEIVQKGLLGEIFLVKTAHRFDNPFEKWAQNPENPKYYWEKGGGPIIDSGVHSADLCNYFLLDEPTYVYAKGLSFPKVLPFFTSAHINVEYNHGGHGIIIINRQTRNYPQYERYLEIIGSERSIWGFDNFYRQTIVFNALSLNELYEGGNISYLSPTAHTMFREYLPANSEIYLELTDFIRTIINASPPPISLEDARKALEICIAAEKSIRYEKEIELPLKE
ncbi:MAG: Gfo/Idh/MocA family oxidoreductase [Candidatus Aenigmarchaeota archaeon]|nr:Gfo/Idh/MocA family oxidoreductase [Candidatus Aenigmarchaeota archaeon]